MSSTKTSHSFLINFDIYLISGLNNKFDFYVDIFKADNHLNSSALLNIIESNNFSPKIPLTLG